MSAAEVVVAIMATSYHQTGFPLFGWPFVAQVAVGHAYGNEWRLHLFPACKFGFYDCTEMGNVVGGGKYK